jgi:hypothetical protein
MNLFARTALFVSACITLGYGQEATPAAVSFDLHESNFGWADFVVGTGLALIALAGWWWFARLIERNRDRIPWKTLNYALPAFGVITLLVIRATAQHLSNAVLGAVLALFLCLNFPAVVGIVIAAIVAGLCRFEPGSAQAMTLYCAGAAVSSYLAVRFFEWRAWTNVPVSLDLQ